MDWKNAFTKATPAWKDAWEMQEPIKLSSLAALKGFLDLVHIKYCLLKPFFETTDYPIVETRELLPSFECDPWEYKDLPSFSMVAFARPINYFNEVFQFDLLHPISRSLRTEQANALIQKNLNVFLARISKNTHETVRDDFLKEDITDLSFYPRLSSYLTFMDRAQVFGMHGAHPQDMHFYLTGVYASFPSDLDTETKRYGLHIGKFSLDAPDMYEKNRNFVLQFLMELYGFPIASERRTSAAIFARKLHKSGEQFFIRTLSQSDRTITSIFDPTGNAQFPLIEKITLVSVDEDYEQLEVLREKGFIIDEKQRIVIFKVEYRQHKFSRENVRQERALSVESQSVIHPITGEVFNSPGIIRDSSNMVLRLNDIVRGEHTGRIVYKRCEIVENTDTEEKRLKFLIAWLSKHQRRMIGYSDEFFNNISRVLNSYFYQENKDQTFSPYKDLYAEALERYNYILQARKIQLLEDIAERNVRGEKKSYTQMFEGAVELLHGLKFEVVNYFDSLVGTAIDIGESMLNERYIIRSYIEKNDDDLTSHGLEIKKNYGRLVALIDELKAIRKSKNDGALRAHTSITSG